tara:strand:- start:29 stop:724 length:696 start_codon:yes stop_codon:yes gene_type:complete
MSGYVGSRARKKRRNIFITIALLFFISFIFFIFPSFQININDPIPDENIIPDPTNDLTSLASNVEELELIVFQKDQKIKFRDGQINNLQTQLKETKTQLEISIKELNKIKDLYDTLILNSDNSVSSDELNILQDKFNALNKENEKNISKINDLNNQIKDLDNSLLSVDQNQKDASIENQKLKKDNKSLFAKNLKLNQTISNLENKINEQNIELNIYLEQIKELKDRSHHGG